MEHWLERDNNNVFLGTWSVAVWFEGEQLEGSPLSVTCVDPSVILLSGPLETILGDDVTFTGTHIYVYTGRLIYYYCCCFCCCYFVIIIFLKLLFIIIINIIIIIIFSSSYYYYFLLLLLFFVLVLLLTLLLLLLLIITIIVIEMESFKFNTLTFMQ